MTTEIHDNLTESAWLELRRADVTSTESACLFGMSPYLTRFELWHRKRSGDVPEFKSNERMSWGNRLETAIAQGIAADRGWTITPMKSYYRLSGERIGASFDFLITSLPEPALLEIKNVDSLAFRDGWQVEDEDEPAPPAHIEVQVQHQQLVSGIRRTYIGALVGGNRTVVIQRDADDDVQRAIRTRIREFWRTVDAGEEPSPVMPEDAQAVIRLNSHAEPGKLIDATGDEALAALVAAYRDAARDESDAKERKEIAKAGILTRIGDAEKVLLPGGSLSCGVVADTPAKVVTAEMIGQELGGRAGYRRMQFFAKRSK